MVKFIIGGIIYRIVCIIRFYIKVYIIGIKI